MRYFAFLRGCFPGFVNLGAETILCLFGCCFHEKITGTPPFRQENLAFFFTFFFLLKRIELLSNSVGHFIFFCRKKKKMKKNKIKKINFKIIKKTGSPAI